MRLVIDANSLVAAFLKPAATRNLVLDNRLELFAPEYLLSEGRKVLKDRFLVKMGVVETTFDQLFFFLTERIQTLAREEYSAHSAKAVEIAPHEEDAPYLACALYLDIPLWSNDKGMKEQHFVKVVSTTELLDVLKRQ